MFPEGWVTTKCSSVLVQMITHYELALLHTTDITVVSLHTQMGQHPSLTPHSKNGNLGSCQFFSHISVAGNTRPISVTECPGEKQFREIILKILVGTRCCTYSICRPQFQEELIFLPC